MTPTRQLSRHPRAIEAQRYRDRARECLTNAPKPQPCEFCLAPDARDEAHARGCPTLEPGTPAELYALALTVERGWRKAR